MREIKFRLWASGDEGLKMFYLNEMEFFDNGVGIWFDSKEHIDDYGDVTIMQYTGLKDKNGKEVYEGDIVKVDNSEPEENGEYDVITVCKWDIGGFILDVGGFVLEDRATGHWTRQLYHKSHRLEVIGNIYENKKLFKTVL